MSTKTRVRLFLLAMIAVIALACFATAAFADGGPLILCPPKSKTCKCTLPRC